MVRFRALLLASCVSSAAIQACTTNGITLENVDPGTECTDRQFPSGSLYSEVGHCDDASSVGTLCEMARPQEWTRRSKEEKNQKDAASSEEESIPSKTGQALT